MKLNWEKIFGTTLETGHYGKYARKPSPDRRHAMVFDPGEEVRMMCMLFQFRLVDARGEVVEPFEGLSAAMQEAWWSRDSRLVVVAISDRRDGLLLYRRSGRAFSVVPFNSYQQTARLTARGVWIAPDLREFRAWFGKGFRPPDPVFFAFSSLRWFPVEPKWKNLGAAFRAAPALRWTPPPSRELRAYARKNGITLIW